jgi:hypothetical protein
MFTANQSGNDIIYETHTEDGVYWTPLNGYWFYIDQRDASSKQIFSFLQLLLNLAETGTADATPVFTISN